MRISKVVISMTFSVLSTTTQALDINDVVDYFMHDKEYAAYECPTSNDAEECSQNCKIYTPRKIMIRIDTIKNDLLVKDASGIIFKGENCSIYDSRNWQCSIANTNFKMNKGKVMSTLHLNTTNSASTYHVCYK